MKRLYSMMMLASVLPAFAGQSSRITVSTDPVDVSHRQFVMKNHIRPQKSIAAASGEQQVITTPPADAEIKMYTRSAAGYSVRWGQAYQESDEGIVGEIAYCANGDVYLKNPTSFYITDSWIKGKMEGSTITFSLPQLVALVPSDDGIEDSEVMEVWLNVVNADYDNGSIGFDVDKNAANQIKMTVDTDGNVTYLEDTETVSLNGGTYTYPKKMMALTNSADIWLGYGDYSNLYKPFNTPITLIPNDLTTTEYAMTFGDTDKNGKWVNVAFDDSKSLVYIDGIYTPEDKGFESLASSAIVGTLLDGAVQFKSRQYVGIDPYYYHTFISGGSVVTENGYQYLDIENEYYMTMDDKRSKLTSSSTMVVSEGENQGYVLEIFFYPIFDSQAGYIDPSPAEPLVTGFMPWTPNYGYGGVKVMIPNTNKNGQLLHDENLSYSIIINDKQIIFDPETYEGFTEATPWIPFNFSSYDVEIDPYTINTRMVFMNEELMDVNTISVQSRYKYQDTYYVTNGQTYIYKLPKFEAPTFSPESGYKFTGESGEVTITAPEGAIVSYRVITEESGSVDFIDATSNVVTLTIDQSCFIQAISKDADGDEERESSMVTATYMMEDGSVHGIAADMCDDIEIYTVAGVRVNRENLEPGLYIIKSGNKTSVVIK